MPTRQTRPLKACGIAGREGYTLFPVLGSKSRVRIARIALLSSLRHCLWAWCLACLYGAAAPVRAEERPIGIILAAGDIATCSTDPVRNGTATASLVMREIEKARASYPDVEVRVIALGDLAYDRGSAGSVACFDKSWGQFRDRILPVPGNHDYEFDGKASAYFSYFNSTFAALNANEKIGTYALDFPSTGSSRWRLIALNSNTSTGAQSPQARWLESELQAARGRCVIAFSHAFFYSSGFHGHKDAQDVGQPLAPLEVMRPLFTTLYNYRTSVFLAGHDHHYEQLGRAGPNAKPDDLGLSAVAVDGVRSFVVGTGGKALYQKDYKKKWAFTEAYDLRSFGILKIELHPTSYSWEFLPTVPSSSMVIVKQMNSDICNLAN